MPQAGDSMFLHGVASGDPHDTDVVLWTRVTVPSRAPVDVHWWVATERRGDGGHDGAGATVERDGVVRAAADTDHTVSVRVDGLPADTVLRYGFRVGDDASPTGHTRTLPDTPRPFRIGVVCCAQYQRGRFDAYRLLAEEAPDLVVHLGDYVYEDGPHVTAVRPVSPPHLARTLTDYRLRHAQTRTDPDLQRLHAVAPFVAVWDDHDVADNTPRFATRQAERRRHAGMRAWSEWLPIDPIEPGTEPIDRELRLPGIVDAYVLDTRFEGRRPAATDGPEVQPGARRRRPLLSEAQWRRFETSFAAPTAAHAIVFSQVQVGPMVLAWRPVLQRAFWRSPFWRRSGWRPIVNPDQWDGHPHERRRLHRAIAARAGSTLVVSGDLHSSWHRTLFTGDDTGEEVDVPDRGPVIAREVTVPSVAGNTYARSVKLRTGLPASVVRWILLRLNRGVDHLDITRHGYAIVDIDPADPAGPQVTSVLIGPGGGTERIAFGAAAGAHRPANQS